MNDADRPHLFLAPENFDEPQATPDQPDNDVLRHKVRKAVEAGKLPRERPKRMWGGKGDGTDCLICGLPVKPDEFGIEIEFGKSERIANPYVHMPCFSALEAEIGPAASRATPK